MKKIYTTLLALLIFGVGFAQQDFAKRVPMKMEKKGTLNKIPYKSSKTAEPEFWFFFSEGIANSLSMTELQGYYTYMLPDSLAITDVASGSRIQHYSYGQIYDFSDAYTWDEMFENMPDENGVPIPNPIMSQALSFDIDQIGIEFGYAWGTEVRTDVVDTLVITIVATPTIEYIPLGAGGVVYHIQPQIPYDIPTANIPTTGHGFPKFYQMREELTIDDTTRSGGYTRYYFFDLETDIFTNLTPDQKIVVTYSFLPGSGPRNLTTQIGKEVNEFQPMFYQDARAGFFIDDDPLSDQLKAEKNSSIDAMDWCLDPTLVFYKEYAPMSVWLGEIMRPSVGIHVTNVESDVSVVKRGKNKISVRPNPATDNFNVVLPEAGAAQIELFNLVGQKVYTANTTEQTVNINVSDLNSGVYMLKVMQNGVVETSKVVVK